MKPPRSSTTLALFLACACMTACASSPHSLAVSAAANLQAAFNEIGTQFEIETGTRVEFNYGATGTLAQQIIQGAPVDVFASADRVTADDLEKRSLLFSDSVRVFARGQIVLYSRSDSPIALDGLGDLSRPEITRFAIANPDRAPYGLAAKEALEKIGLWQSLQSKIILAENIQQTLQYADTGNVDAAIVALSLAMSSKGRWKPIPQDLYSPIDQALGIVKATKNENQAREFTAFVLGENGRTILSKYGYALPSE